MTTTTPDDPALLAREIREHEMGLCSFANVIASERGWSSKAGRIVDNVRFLNPDIAFRLEEEAPSSTGPGPDLERTGLAKAIARLEPELTRSRRRRPMSDEARRVASEYLAEWHHLYRRAESMLGNPFALKVVRWHLARMVKLSEAADLGIGT